MRTSWANVQDDSVNDKIKTSNQITRALKTLFANVENYPDLKASNNFMQLQNSIVEIEDEIADRREFYNDSVNEFNIKIQVIPYNALSGILGYRQLPFFSASPDAKAPVQWKS